MGRTRTFGLAAETAFWLFLSLLPLLAVGGFVAARLSLENWSGVMPIVATLPPAARGFVREELTKLSMWDQTVGITASLTFLWLASSGVHAIFDALEVETATHRRWYQKRALAVVACLGLSLSMAALAVLGPGVQIALSDIGRRLPFLTGLPAAGPTIRVFLGLVVLVAQTSTLYWIGIPRQTRVRMPLWPGVLTTAVLQVALSFGYAMYLSTVGDGAAYTAGLTVVGLVLTALYLFVVALLIGATVNRMLGSFEPECH
jgi:membrane protein